MGLFDETDLAKKKEEQKKKSKKMLILIGIGIFTLFVALVVVLYFIINPPGEPPLKLYIDGVENADLIDYVRFDKNDNKKIDSFSISHFAKALGYNQYLGNYYDVYNEEIDNECYVEKPDIEVTMFKYGNSKITKHSLLADIPDAVYDIKEMVDEEKKDFFINEEGFMQTFNCRVYFDTENNRIIIQTLESIVEQYKKECKLIVAPGIPEEDEEEEDPDKKLTYTDFCNQKAILNGYFVIRDPNTGYLGLCKLSSLNTDPNSKDYLSPLKDAKSIDINISNILTLKANYKEIQFQETTGHFIVTTKNGNMGIYNADGKKIVEPSYKSITEIKKQGNTYLYVVKSNEDKWGIVNSNDKVVIKPVYDQIGIDSDIDDKNVTNRYILYDNFIPAKLNGKWLFFNLTGSPDLENIANAEYCIQDGITNIGCKIENSTKEKSGLVMVPFEDVDGLIVQYAVKNEETGQTDYYYGVLSTTRYKMELWGGTEAYKKTTTDGEEIYMLADESGDFNLANYIKTGDEDDDDFEPTANTAEENEDEENEDSEDDSEESEE